MERRRNTMRREGGYTRNNGNAANNNRKTRLKTKKRSPKFILPMDVKIEYKDIALLQKFITDRGKIVSRRLSGVTGEQQRNLSLSIKRARYLGLLSVGSSKR